MHSTAAHAQHVLNLTDRRAVRTELLAEGCSTLQKDLVGGLAFPEVVSERCCLLQQSCPRLGSLYDSHPIIVQTSFPLLCMPLHIFMHGAVDWAHGIPSSSSRLKRSVGTGR